MIHLALYTAEGLPWEALDDRSREGLIEAFAGRGMMGTDGNRYSVWNPTRRGFTVVGTFTHETSESITDYRPGQAGSLERVPGATRTFEDYAFVVWFDEGIVALQRRRLPSTKELDTDTVERDFAAYLSDASVRTANRVVVLRAFEGGSNEAEVRSLMMTGRVVRLKVSGLSGRRVPEGLDLTNPRPEVNEVLHEYVNYDTEVRGVNEVTIQADQRRADADVAQSFYAKGIVASGTLDEVVVMAGGKRIRAIRESRHATISIEDPITHEAAEMLLRRILKADFDQASSEEQPTLFGPA